MKRPRFMIGASILLLFGVILTAQRTATWAEASIDYPGPKPQGLTPEVFAPGFISEPGASVFNISFALDGQMIVFRRNRNNVAETLVTEYKEGRWTKPQVSPLFPEVPDFVSPSKAYYALRDKIFVMEKTPNGWSEGKLLIEVKNSGPRFTVAGNGNIYVPVFLPVPDTSHGESNLDIFVLRLKNGVYQAPERLPDSVNSNRNEEHLYIAPDESYLLFDSERPGGLGKSDLYISFLRPDGSWSQPRNLGSPINTAEYDFNGRVSPDGKYLFYCSGADGQLHWVDFQAVLRSIDAPAVGQLGQTRADGDSEALIKAK